MYTLSQIRRHVDSLKQKYATELTILRLRPLAEEFCLLWSEAIIDGNPPPDSYAFIRHIARQGFRLNTYTGLHLYLERCSENGRNPNINRHRRFPAARGSPRPPRGTAPGRFL